jgi:hypothetical protein
MKRLVPVVIFISFILAEAVFSDESSILALNNNSQGRLTKARPSNQQSSISRSIESQQAEQLQYRSFLVVINRNQSGKYELQVSKTVRYGDKQISSIYASQYQTSVEYEYRYESSSGKIRQDHFLFPANSLTGWANPGDYVTMREFAWKGRFPSQNCSSAVHTSEEFGREYLEASCFPSRDAAIQFAKRFVNYVLGPRGL